MPVGVDVGVMPGTPIPGICIPVRSIIIVVAMKTLPWWPPALARPSGFPRPGWADYSHGKRPNAMTLWLNPPKKIQVGLDRFPLVKADDVRYNRHSRFLQSDPKG